MSPAWYCSHYLPPVSLTPVANLPPVSLIPVTICHRRRWHRRQICRYRWHRWQICHLCQQHWWCTLTCEYVREFSKKFETVLMGYSGAGGEMIHKKTRSKKSRDTVPLTVFQMWGKLTCRAIVRVLLNSEEEYNSNTQTFLNPLSLSRASPPSLKFHYASSQARLQGQGPIPLVYSTEYTWSSTDHFLAYIPSWLSQLWCTLQLKGHKRSPYFSSTPICTLWFSLTRGGSFKELSLASLAKLSWLRHSWLRFGLASAGYRGLGVHNRPVYTAG